MIVSVWLFSLLLPLGVSSHSTYEVPEQQQLSASQLEELERKWGTDVQSLLSWGIQQALTLLLSGGSPALALSPIFHM